MRVLVSQTSSRKFASRARSSSNVFGNRFSKEGRTFGTRRLSMLFSETVPQSNHGACVAYNAGLYLFTTSFASRGPMTMFNELEMAKA